jgi:hypothetical protein
MRVPPAHLAKTAKGLAKGFSFKVQLKDAVSP